MCHICLHVCSLRLQQLEAARQPAGPTAAFTVGEMQKQLGQLKQQMMFKDQEVGAASSWGWLLVEC